MRIEALNVEVNPTNAQELSINVNYDKDSNEATSNINDFTFQAEDLALFLNWINSGRIFEGVPLTIYPVNSSTDSINVLLDVSNANPISQHSITIPAIQRDIDWFTRNSSFTLSFLYERISFAHPNFNFIPIPYTVNDDKSRLELAITFISCVSVVVEAFNMLQQLIQLIVKSASFSWENWIASIPFFIYALVVSLAVIQTLLMLYNLLIQPVKFHYGMKYKDILIVGFAYMGLKFESTVFDLPKFDKLVYLPEKREEITDTNNNLLLEFIGLDLSVLRGLSQNVYGEQKGYPEKTFTELVNDFKLLCNGKMIFEENNVVRIERKDYLDNSVSSYILPDLDNPDYTFNTPDIWSSFYLTFATDEQDSHTINNYNGNAFTEIIVPENISDKKNLTLANRVEVRLAFARGTIKTSLSNVENIVKLTFAKMKVILTEFERQHNFKLRQLRTTALTFFDVTNALLPSALQLDVPDEIEEWTTPIAIPDLNELISGRIGMLQLSSENVGVPKLLILNDNLTYINASQLTSEQVRNGSFFPTEFNPQRLNELLNVTSNGGNPRLNTLDSSNTSILSAENIFNEFYSIDSPVPNIKGVTDWNNGLHGQRKQKKVDKVWFTPSNWNQIKNNGAFKDAEGNICKFEGALNFKPIEQSANFNYSFSYIYCRNLKSIKYNSNGSRRDA
jgi:hypothetical protein